MEVKAKLKFLLHRVLAIEPIYPFSFSYLETLFLPFIELNISIS